MLSGKRILIIEDDAAVVKGIELRLKMAGYETIAANDAATGIAKAIDALPDAILVDLQLGNEDGLGVLKALRQRSETIDVPIVIVSGRDSASGDALNAGATAFLAKPFRGNEVVALVNRLTGAICEGRTV